MIVWDEGATHGVDNPIGLIVVSPLAKRGYSNAVAYSHASTVRTVQEVFGVTPLLRKAATATDEPLPVVLFSALPEDHLQKLARTCGADGHVAKTEGLAGLVTNLTELCEQVVW